MEFLVLFIDYLGKFLEFRNQNFTDIRGACKFEINDILENFDNREKLNDNFYIKKIIKSFIWKFRFIIRKLN